MGGLFGGNKDASRAAQIQNQYHQRAIDEQRRQFDITQNNIKPFLEAGVGALPEVVEGSTVEGLDNRLAEIFNTDIFRSLADERQRGLQGQLAAGGLTRSGTALQEAAKIPTDLGLALEGLLNARATNLVGLGQNSAVGMGKLGRDNSNEISDLIAGQGQNYASGILADRQSRSRGIENLMGTAILAKAVGFFSDPRLKIDATKISEIGNLSLWEWDWIEGAKGTVIEKCPTIGFMADEVAEKYPRYVSEFCGFAVIDYPQLLNELEAKYGLAANSREDEDANTCFH